MRVKKLIFSNYKIILIFVVAVLGVIYFSSYIHFNFMKYKVVDNFEDLGALNEKAIMPFDYIKDDFNEERSYVLDLSSSFFHGYKTLSSPYMDGEVYINNLSDFDYMNLAYIFMTSGDISYCIKKNLFQKMYSLYFDKGKLKITSQMKKTNYDIFKGAFCFEKTDFVDNSFVLTDYEKKGNVIYLKYQEYDLNNGIIINWDIRFLVTDKGYYLNYVNSTIGVNYNENEEG